MFQFVNISVNYFNGGMFSIDISLAQLQKWQFVTGYHKERGMYWNDNFIYFIDPSPLAKNICILI